MSYFHFYLEKNKKTWITVDDCWTDTVRNVLLEFKLQLLVTYHALLFWKKMPTQTYEWEIPIKKGIEALLYVENIALRLKEQSPEQPHSTFETKREKLTWAQFYEE